MPRLEPAHQHRRRAARSACSPDARTSTPYECDERQARERPRQRRARRRASGPRRPACQRFECVSITPFDAAGRAARVDEHGELVVGARDDRPGSCSASSSSSRRRRSDDATAAHVDALARRVDRLAEGRRRDDRDRARSRAMIRRSSPGWSRKIAGVMTAPARADRLVDDGHVGRVLHHHDDPVAGRDARARRAPRRAAPRGRRARRERVPPPSKNSACVVAAPLEGRVGERGRGCGRSGRDHSVPHRAGRPRRCIECEHPGRRRCRPGTARAAPRAARRDPSRSLGVEQLAGLPAASGS